GMVEEARAYHPERHIDLVADASLPGLFDRSRIEQVIGNLIGNAIEHGTADTPVTVTLKDEEGIAVLLIHNDGPPIEASVRASLFNPMVRHQPSGHLLYGAGAGLGLELYIASAIVSAHHGSIEVHSKAGRGTTFTVRFPLNMPDAI